MLAYYRTIELEAPENRRLADMLVPPLRLLLDRLSTVEKARAIATRALRGLQGFASVFKVKVGEVEGGVSEPGVAASGHLETDLPDLLLLVGEAARAADTAVALLLDEVQYLSAEDLAALIVSIHRIGQRGLPLAFFGAGLPSLAALAGEAKSYAERLFDYPEVGALGQTDAERAIRGPLRSEGAEIEAAALLAIVERTKGYPYFLQELIRKGMVYSPQHGDTAFTVPMFDIFMKRSMPEWVAPNRQSAEN